MTNLIAQKCLQAPFLVAIQQEFVFALKKVVQ